MPAATPERAPNPTNRIERPAIGATQATLVTSARKAGDKVTGNGVPSSC